jgi:ATP adenylyltransferase
MKSPIWAPWRMEYLLQPKRPGCVLCAIGVREPANHDADHVLVDLPDALVCLNRYPIAAGHLLVFPRRHVGDLLELDEREYASLMHTLREAAARLRAAVRCDGLNLGFNIGEAAGASIAEHAHGHVVPRWSGDTNFMPVLADVRVMPQHLDATHRHLAPYFADFQGLRASGAR